jgi:hypothetical protein
MVGAVARRPVAVAVEPLLPRQQPIERGDQVLVRAGADLDDDKASRRVGHEHGQEPVPAIRCLGREPGALAGQVDQPAARPRPDRELAGPYGKMFRRASRSRPSPPAAGADS